MQIGDESIVYCYIRKNACSAFKGLFLKESKYRSANYRVNNYKSLFFYHRVRFVCSARRAKWRVFVYRDPFDRTVSFFRNKLIAQRDSRAAERNVLELTGVDPNKLTFSSFVQRYITLPQHVIDPHARTQRSHLLDLDYNCVSTLATLHSDMKTVLGARLADRYFATNVNSTRHHLFDDPAADLTVAQLRSIFAASGSLPSDSSLNDQDTRELLKIIYADDYMIGNRLEWIAPQVF